MRRVLKPLAPHFFVAEPLPEKITDPDFLKKIEMVKNAKSLDDAMKIALDIIAKKYNSRRLETYVYYHKMFEKNADKIWRRSGFLHCTLQNFLFRILLVKSGWLQDNQIELGYSLIWYISPHQYLKVNTGKKIIAVDPWNYNLGATLGKYAAGFGMKSL